MNIFTLFLQVAVFFSPNYGGPDCTKEIIAELSAASNTVYVQAYNFTSEDIGAALVAAKKRGVDVRVIVDRVSGSQKGEQVSVCKNAGIPVLTDKAHKIAHNKVMIIDGAVVITGSFNFSDNAEKSNAENLLVVVDKKIAAEYIQNWKKHQEHSQ